MYANMELWSEIRRRVLTGEISKREACKQYQIHWITLKKILAHEEPPEVDDHAIVVEQRVVDVEQEHAPLAHVSAGLGLAQLARAVGGWGAPTGVATI